MLVFPDPPRIFASTPSVVRGEYANPNLGAKFLYLVGQACEERRDHRAAQVRPGRPGKAGTARPRSAFRCNSACHTRACWPPSAVHRSEEHTSELQSLRHLVCRL